MIAWTTRPEDHFKFREAAVDRTFLYRHRDLLEQIHAAETQPPASGGGSLVSRASLQADLANAQGRNGRLAAWPPASTNSSAVSPNSSANKPGVLPASAPPTTSTDSNARSSSSNRQSSILRNSSKNAHRRTRRRPRHQPRTHDPPQHSTQARLTQSLELLEVQLLCRDP